MIKMRYKVIDSLGDAERIVVTDDGGVACIRDVDGDGYCTTIDLYQEHFTQEMLDNDNLWEEVGEGKLYHEDSEFEYTSEIHIKEALEWLAPFCDVYEMDENIWEDFQ